MTTTTTSSLQLREISPSPLVESATWPGFHEHLYAFESDDSLARLLQGSELGSVAASLQQLFVALEADGARNTHAKLNLTAPDMEDAAHVSVCVPIDDALHPDKLAGERGVTTTCMSCNVDVPLWRGLNRKNAPSDADLARLTSGDCIMHSSDHTNVWVDAKGRRVLIFTPKRHVERVSELTPSEWADLLATVALFSDRATRAIINHGSLQNHAHLHLKLFFGRSSDMPELAVPRMRLCAKLYSAVRKGPRIFEDEE